MIACLIFLSQYTRLELHKDASAVTAQVPNFRIFFSPMKYTDSVHITLVKANLMAYFWRFSNQPQFSSLESILHSVLHMMHLWFGMTLLMRSAQQNHLPLSDQSWSHTFLEKHIQPKFPISSCFLRGDGPCNVSGLWLLNNSFVRCALD